MASSASSTPTFSNPRPSDLGFPPKRIKDRRGLDCLAGPLMLQDDAAGGSVALNLQEFRLQKDVHAAFAETLLHDFGCIFVKSSRNLRSALHDRNPTPKDVQVVSEFKSHGACTENDERLWNSFEV